MKKIIFMMCAILATTMMAKAETSVTVECGEQVELTATANTEAHYHFVKWYYMNGTTEVDASSDNPWIFTPDVTRTYIAKFALDKVKISVAWKDNHGTASTGGSVAIKSGEESLTSPHECDYGTALALVATPDDANCYEFWKWEDEEGDVSTIGATRNITASEDKTYTAIFRKVPYTITVEANPVAGGSVSVTKKTQQ